jgi:type IX secretion system PorP/SprF family membrane protein
MKRIFVTITVSYCVLATAHAQSPVFSQYYASAMYLNPALAGLERNVFVGMNYRMQWSTINMPFNTFQFTVIQPITREGFHSKHLGGVGLSFLNDVAGQNQEFITRSVLMSAAYNFHMNRYGNNIISVALQGGCTQQRFNDSQLQWSSQYSSMTGYDNTLPGESGMPNNQVINPTVNAGVMWHRTSKDRYARKKTSMFQGFAASNINRTSGFFMSQAPSAILLKAHGGVSIIENKILEFSPNYLIQYQNHLYQFNIGAYAGYAVQSNGAKITKVSAGVWYRMQDAFIVSTGFSSSTLTLGFSYDTNVSSLSRNFGNATAYEFSLAYRAAKNKNIKRFSSPLI